MWDWDAEQPPGPAVLPGVRAVVGAVALLGLLAAGFGLYLRESGPSGVPQPSGTRQPLHAREPATQDLAVGEELLLSSAAGPARVTVEGVTVGKDKCTPESRGAVVVRATISGAAPIVPSAFTLTTADGAQVPGSSLCPAPGASVRIGFDATSVRLVSYTPYGGDALGSWRLG